MSYMAAPFQRNTYRPCKQSHPRLASGTAALPLLSAAPAPAQCKVPLESPGDWVSSGDCDWVIGNYVPCVSRDLGLRDRGWYQIEELIKHLLSVYFGERSLFTWRSVRYD